MMACCFTACQKDEVIENEPENNLLAEQELSLDEIPEAGIDQSALIIDGVPFFAGTGYSPTQDRLFAPAIDNFDMFESTDIPVPLDVDVEIIRNNEELEKYVRKEIIRRTGGLFAKIFGFGRSSKTVIENRMNISESNISVVARISVQSARYLVDGAPFLNSRAQQLVDQGRIGDFIRRHGPGYVDSQVVGGDVYYIYNYDLNSISIERKTTYERNILINIKNWFNIPTGVVLSNDDKREIQNSIERYAVESNIIGFTPALINSSSQLSGEVQRIQNYLNQNPTNAASMEMTVASYANILQYEGFTTEYNKAIKCYQDWEGWSELKAKVDFIYANTTVSSTRSQAQTAVNYVNQQLENSRNCTNSLTPNLNQYNALENTYNAERRAIEIEAARKNITIWHGVGGPGVGGCTSNPVTFSLLAYQLEGSIPLYELRLINGSASYDIYRTSYDPQKEEIERIAGYIFPNQEPGAVDLNLVLVTQFGCDPIFPYVVDYTLGIPPNATVPPNSRLGYVFPKK